MNISPKTVAALRQDGWDIVRVSDVLPATTADDEILRFARAEDRVLITEDLDFSALLALGGHSKPSLVTLRTSYSDPDSITARLRATLPGLEPRFSQGIVATVTDTAVRMRQLPIR